VENKYRWGREQVLSGKLEGKMDWQSPFIWTIRVFVCLWRRKWEEGEMGVYIGGRQELEEERMG